jgi:multidrug resistance efflux pump
MAQPAPMTTEAPKLRSDLVISRHDGVVVVKDPVTGQFFRLREIEHFIASQLDGATALEEIRARTAQKFGVAPAPQAAEGFVATLGGHGLLEITGAGPAAPAPPVRRLRGDPLHLRLSAFDPDALLDRLVGKVRLGFTPGFVALSAALILVGLGMAIDNRAEIARDVVRLYGVEAVLAAWLALFVVTAAHEFAHGLACKHFGGHVREMGVLLIYFHPAFYCNVSDAWLFPEKSRRLWVTAAGPYVELVLWALAVLTWRLTDSAVWLNWIALVVAATSGIRLFFNLNPLIRLDGYYLLSDALGIPNLRARAFRYVGDRLARLWGLPARAFPDASPRERRIYLIYGLLAGGYSAWLLGWLAWASGSFLTERYQGAGALLYAGLLVAVFQNRLRGWTWKPALAWPGRGGLASVKRPVKLLIALGAGLAVLFLGRMELTVSGEFTVAPRHNADVRAEVDGLVAEVYVAEGQRVAKGDRIARLADRDYRAQLRAADAQIAETHARLKLLRAGPRQEEITVARQAVETGKTRREHAGRRAAEAEQVHAARLAKARADVAKAEEQLRYAHNDLSRVRALFAADLISRREFEEAQERAGVRKRELEAAQADQRALAADDLAEIRKELAMAGEEAEEAQARLGLLEAGSRPEEIEAAAAGLARLEGERQRLLEQLELVDVRSPVTGVVTTPKPVELTGRYVKTGDLIVEVHALEAITAEIAVPEKEIGDVGVGQRVVLRTRAFPERSFLGRVTATAPAAAREAEETWRGKIVRVTTVIDNPDLLLKPEMTGNAKIYCGERRIFDLLTRRLARYLRVEVWSWW